MKTVIKFISLCLLLLIMTGCPENVSTPEQTAKRLVSAIFHYGGSSLYSLLYIENDEQLLSNDLLKGKIRNISIQRSNATKDRGGIKNVEYSPVEYFDSNKARASMYIKVTFNDGSVQDMPITLVKVDGKWLVLLKI